MACSIIRNKSGEISRVLAPNSKDSILFKDIMELPALAGDKEQALRMWAIAYTPEFKNRHGDWENGESLVNLDENGEPVVGYVAGMKDMSGINYNLSADAVTYEEEKARLERDFKIRFYGSNTDDMRKAQRLVANINNVAVTGEASLHAYNDDMGRMRYMIQFNEVRYDSMKDVKGFSTQDSEYQEKKRQVNEVVDRLLDNVKGVDVQWIHPSELKQSDHPGKNLRSINAFAKGNTVYLVEGRVTPDIGMEEVMHFVVELLKVDRPALATRLFKQAQVVAPALWAEIERTYTNEKGFTMGDRRSELITRVLQKEYAKEIENNAAREFDELRSILSKMFNWLKELLNKVFREKGYNVDVAVDFSEMPLDTTFAELAAILNTRNVLIEAYSIDNVLYNMEEPENADLDKELPVPGEEEKKDDSAWKQKILERQLERVDKQLEYLKLAERTSKPNASQRATLQKFRQQLLDYKQILINTPNKTRRVSRVIGQTDATGAENYANFGTFVHNMLEELQVRSLETGQAPIVLFEREDFNERYKETMDNPKTAFDFKGMTQEDVYKMTKEVIGFLGDVYAQGHILIPEMTMISKDPIRGAIVGRIDFMAIDKKGRVTIYDLKTARVNAGELPHNKLAKEYKKETFLPGVTPEFGMLKMRSKFMDYDAQLSVYERMMKQAGIEVNERIILSLIYANKNKNMRASNKDFEFASARVHRYSEFDYAYRTEYERDEEGNIISEKRVLRREFKRIREAAIASVYIEGETFDEREEATHEVVNLFELFQDTTLDEFIDLMVEGIDKQLSQLREELKKSEAYYSDPKVKEYYQNRSKQLYQIKEEMLKANDEDKLSLAKGMKLSAAIAALNLSAQQIEEEAARLDALPLTTEERLKRLSEIKTEAENLEEILGIIAEVGERNKLSSTEPVMQVLATSRAALSNAISKYRQQGERIMIEYIKESVPEEFVKQIYESRGQYIEGRIKGLEREITELENPEWKPAVWQARKRFTYTPQQIEQLRKEKLAEKQQELQKLLADQGKKSLTEQDIEDYVYSLMNNKDSRFYLGSNTSVTPIGFGLGDLISNSSNPELIVYAAFNKLRSLTNDAQNTAMNNFYEMEFDTHVKNFVSRKGGESAANAVLREKRTVTYYNEDGTTYTRDHYSFKNPVMQSYFDAYEGQRRLIADKRKLLNDLRRQRTADPTNQELNDQFAALDQEINSDVKKFNEWLQRFTEREFIDEYYDLSMSLPASVQAELDIIDEAISRIRSTKVGSEELLNETQLDQIHELELQRNKIYQEALKSDPDYQKKMERYRELKTFDENWGLYNKIRAEKIAAYGIDSEEFKRWEKLNKTRRPSDKFYKDVNRIYERIDAILGGQDPEMTALRAERSKIRRKYKMNGTFYSGNMDPQDIEAYDALEEKIEAIRKKAALEEGEDGLPLEVRKKLGVQYERLSKLQTQKQTESYTEELNKRVTELEKVANELREIESIYDYSGTSSEKALEERYINAQTNYYTLEEQFTAWYNKNHTNLYEPDTFRNGKVLDPAPKKIHFEQVPVEDLDDSYFEEVLHRKFRMSRPTEAAKNPRYQLTPEGYPVPKGLQLVNNRWEISGTNEFINPEFVKLTQNQTDYDFYNWLVMDNYIAKQDGTVGRKLAFLFPGVEMNKVDNIKEFGLIEGIKREYEETAQEVVLGKNKSQTDIASNEYGSADRMRVRFKHNFPLDAMLTTTNGITAVGMWMVEREINHEMGKADIAFSAIIDAMEGMRDHVTDTTKMNQLNKAIELVTFERDKFIYGKRMKGGDKDINTMKGLRLFMKAVSFGRLGFDFAAQTGNMLSGNVQTFLNAQKGDYTPSNLLYAKKKVYNILGSMISDYGKVSDVSFETKLVRFMNPNQKELSELVNLNTKSQLDRFLTQSMDFANLAYMLQDKGETEIALTTMVAIMDHHKYKVFDLDASGEKQYDTEGNVMYKMENGEPVLVNGFDIFTEDNTGKIVTRKDVDVTSQQVKMLRNKVYSQILKAQGNYADWTSTHISSTQFGVMMEYFKKYFVHMALRRFGKHQEDFEGMKFAAGWYRIMYDMFRQYGFKEGIKAMIPGNNKSEVNEYYRTGSLQAGRELLTGLVMMMLYGYLRGLAYSDDDDEVELNWMEMQIMRTFAKVISESRSMIPVPFVGNVNTYIDSFSNFTSVFREGKTMWKLVENSLSLMGYEIFGDSFEEAAFYQKRYGMYEAGDPKALKNFHDLIGYDNIIGIFEPEYKLKEQFKNK
jgi:hypothetical protein